MMKVFLVLLLSLPLKAQDNILVLLGLDESHLVTVGTHRLSAQTAQAFVNMQAAAATDGIDLQLVSAFRSFERQQQIFEEKFRRYRAEGLSPTLAIDRILQYSTIPGTSRHHWGTDIDITDGNAPKQKHVLVPSKFHNDGPFVPLHQWMQANAHRFGFYLVYTRDSKRTGFAYEPWHYTYLPEAKEYLAQYTPRMAFAYFKAVGVKGGTYIDRDFWDAYYTQFVLGVNTELIK